MNPGEVPVAEIIAGSVVGLAVIYFGGTAILNSLRSWHGRDRIDTPPTPTRPNKPVKPSGCSQAISRDQRPAIFQPRSNRGQQPSSKNRRPR